MFIHCCCYCCYLGAVIGTVVCSLFNTEGPMGPTGYPDPDNRSPRHQHSTYYPPRPSNNRENHKSKTKKLKGIIL